MCQLDMGMAYVRKVIFHMVSSDGAFCTLSSIWIYPTLAFSLSAAIR